MGAQQKDLILKALHRAVSISAVLNQHFQFLLSS